MRPQLLTLALTAAIAGGACSATSQSAARQLSPQTLSRMQLTGVDGAGVDLRQTIRAHDATLLVWWATRCPCVKRYQRRIEALREAFPVQRVALLAIASNADDDASSAMREARARQMSTPLVMDPGGQLAAALGARTTPTAVLLDRQGNVVFHGWIDNEREPGQAGREPYVRRAIEATLASREPAPRTTPVYGCLITKRLGEPQRCLPAPEPGTCHAGH